MKLLSIARSWFSPSTAHAGRTQNVAPRPLKAPAAGRPDLQLWTAQLPDAWRLVGELDKMLPPSRSTQSPTGGLQRLAHSAFKPAPGMGNQTDVALNAHHVGHRSMAMDRAESPASAAFAALCLQKDVRAVIDLSAINAPGRSCMKSNAPWVKGDTRVEFRCPMQNNFPLEQRWTLDGHTAIHRPVGVYLAVNGKPHPLLNERARVTWNNGGDPAATVMDWVRMPMDSQRAISPRTLLALSQKADSLCGEAGHCVFQSSDGGRLSGLFAVAHDLYRELKKPQGRGADLMDKVTEACVRGRAKLSHDLFSTPEDVASLMAMARLMEQERGRA